MYASVPDTESPLVPFEPHNITCSQFITSIPPARKQNPRDIKEIAQSHSLANIDPGFKPRPSKAHGCPTSLDYLSCLKKKITDICQKILETDMRK